LQKIEARRLFQEPECPDVFESAATHLQSRLFDLQDWIKGNVASGVGLAAPDKVDPRGEMAPAAWLQFLGAAPQRCESE
jgi:hypothetical protein